MHTSRPTHPHHGHQHHGQRDRSGQGHSTPSLVTDEDRQLLLKLLSNPQEAQEMYSMLQNSPPEIANLGYLILRVFECSMKV
jgi:hypothetical protein